MGPTAAPGQSDSQALDASEKGGFVDAQFPGRRGAVIIGVVQGRADGLGIDQVVSRAPFPFPGSKR